MVEGTTLERWHTGNRIEGSNPSLSVACSEVHIQLTAIGYQLSEVLAVILDAPPGRL